MNHLDLFSGIGGFALGLQRNGFKTVCMVEIEKYCQQELGRHMDNGELDQAAIYDDVTDFDGKRWRGQVDIVTGGSPCQDFSIAGKRQGLAGERSGLFWHFVRILDEVRPTWFLFENVPGLLSSCSCPRCLKAGRVLQNHRGTDFLVVLSALGEIGYGVAGRVLDAQYFGVPQRRRRIFLAGHLGGPCPPEVLFEPKGSGGDPAKGGKTGKDVAFTLRANPSKSGDKGDGGINTTLVNSLESSQGGPDDNDTQGGRLIVQQAMSCKWAKGYSGPARDEHHNLIAAPLGGGANKSGRMSEDVPWNVVTHPLTAEGHDASEDGSGRGTPITVARSTGAGYYTESEVASVRAETGGTTFDILQQGMGVRRLMPIECERLQGFPDNWTSGADSPRYRALGNAVAVPVIEWIAKRIRKETT